MEDSIGEMKYLSKCIQLDLAKGNLQWEDERVQFFIPVALYFTEFDWLHLIAENNLIEEDCQVVKNFLNMVEGLTKVNQQQLNGAVGDKLKRILGDD